MPLPIGVALFAKIAGGALVAGLLARRARQQQRRADDGFIEAWARARGLRARPTRVGPTQERAAAEVQVHDVCVRAWRGRGDDGRTALFASARYLLLGGAQFQSHFSALPLFAAHVEPRVVISPAFDRFHVTTGRVGSVVRSVLTPELADRLVAVVPSVRIDSDVVRVTVSTPLRHDDEADRAALDVLVDVVGAMASPGVPELAQLVRACGGVLTPGTFDQPACGHIEADGTRVRLAAQWRNHHVLGRTLSVMAVGGGGRALPAFSARVGVEGNLVGSMPVGLLGPEEAALIPEAGRVVLRSSGGRELSVAWPDLPESGQVLAGSRLIARLTSTRRSQGAFR